MAKLLTYLSVIFCLLMPVASAAPVDQATLAEQLWQAQTLKNMQCGIYAIPESSLNSYFTSVARDNPKVKEASLTVLDNNKLQILLNADGTGLLRFTCSINQLRYDRDRAVLWLYVEKKEMVGHPLASWVMDHMSMGLLTSIYGNPLEAANINGKFKGNMLTLDLRPFTTGLFDNGPGRSVGDMLMISEATTSTGVVYLHTNFAIGLPVTP